MERKELKRGFEEMNLEKEEESAAKQPKPSEIVKEETNKDEEFEDLSPYCSKPPVLVCSEESEAVNLGSKEEASVKQTEFSGENEEFHPDDCPMSDDWLYISWQNNTSSLWVVTKSPDSWAWMKDALKSDVCNQYKIVQEQKTFKIDLNEKFKNRVSSCSCVLFCFGNDQWDSGSLQEVADLSSSYGMKKVIILLSEKSPDTWPPQEMNDQHNFPVLKFSKQEIAWYKDNLDSYNTKIESMKKIVKDSWKYHKVGIFSRSSEIDYEWLKKKLESEYFRDAVENVQSYYISNRGFNQFMTNVSNCTFGILYHTKNRGRINITDVTDSLYDEELNYMSRMMNRNVIVVVDDLNNGDNEEKSRILRSQPSIKEKALDMFLFTAEEKKYLEPLMKLRNVINGETIKENE